MARPPPWVVPWWALATLWPCQPRFRHTKNSLYLKLTIHTLDIMELQSGNRETKNTQNRERTAKIGGENATRVALGCSYLH
jgi:hypothetical protein